MAGSLKTPNYEIPYYAGTDIISNSTNTAAMLKIDSAIKAADTKATNVNDIATEAKEAAENAVTQVESVVDSVGRLVESDSKNTEAIAVLKNQDAVINAHIVDLQNKDESIEQEVETLNNSVSSVSTSVAELGTEVNTLKTNSSEMQTSITAVSNTAVDNSNKLNVIETTTIPTLQSSVTSNTTEINNNAGAISALEADVAGLSGKNCLPLAGSITTMDTNTGGFLYFTAPEKAPGIYLVNAFLDITRVDRNAIYFVLGHGVNLTINAESTSSIRITGFLTFQTRNSRINGTIYKPTGDYNYEIEFNESRYDLGVSVIATPSVNITRKFMDNGEDTVSVLDPLTLI